MQQTTCCFFGHKKITESEELRRKLYQIIEEMILKNNVDTFLFGSNSQFNSLCLELVSALKEKYPHIKRVYVRAEFPFINNDYEAYLLERYEDTFFPEALLSAGKAVYVERNQKMIDRSAFCVIYYLENYCPANRKSGTKLALRYAEKKKKTIILLP